jgi:hypothetical protein
MPFFVSCDSCGANAIMDGAQMADPDAHLDCHPDKGCCLKDHHHGVQAGTCDQQHEGPCEVANPDCAVCRSITIMPLPGTAQVSVG